MLRFTKLGSYFSVKSGNLTIGYISILDKKYYPVYTNHFENVIEQIMSFMRQNGASEDIEPQETREIIPLAYIYYNDKLLGLINYKFKYFLFAKERSMFTISELRVALNLLRFGGAKIDWRRIGF